LDSVLNLARACFQSVDLVGTSISTALRSTTPRVVSPKQLCRAWDIAVMERAGSNLAFMQKIEITLPQNAGFHSQP